MNKMKPIQGEIFIINGDIKVEVHKNLISSLSNPVMQISVEPRLMALLLILFDQAGEIIQKRILLEKVWGNPYASEEVVTLAVSRLRKAFKELGETNNLIKTHPKKGYSFVGTIGNFAIDDTVSPLKSKTKNRLLFAGLSLLVIIISLTVFFLDRPNSTLTPLELTYLTHEKGLELTPYLSKDGKFLLYSQRKSTEKFFDIILQDLSSNTTENLTRTVEGDCMEAVWAPSGDSIAFVQHYRGLAWVVLMDLKTNNVKSLISCNPLYSINLSWSEDGKNLINIHKNNEKPDLLYRYDFHKKENELIKSYARIKGRPAYNSDGELLIATSDPGKKNNIRILDFFPEKEKVIPAEININNLSWKSGNQILISDDEGKLYLYYLNKRKLEFLGVDNLAHIHYSPSQKILSGISKQIDANIWALNLENDTITPLVNTNRMEWNPSLSPDGQFISFLRETNDQIEHCLKDNKTGSEYAIQRNDSIPLLSPVRWAPNSKAFAFLIEKEGQSKFLVYDLDQKKIQLLEPDLNYSNLLQWDRNGEALYVLLKDSGKSSIHQIPIDEGDISTIVQLPFLIDFAQIDLERNQLYYSRGDVGLKKRDLSKSTEQVIHGIIDKNDLDNWMILKGKLYFITRKNSAPILMNLDLHSGNLSLLKSMEAGQFFEKIIFSIHPENKQLIFHQYDQLETDVVSIKM